MSTLTRQPFGEIGAPRLQALQSAKNKQNAFSPNINSSLKPNPQPSTGKRQRAPEIFSDYDAENVDPSVFLSPSKKSKTSISEAGWVKPAPFSLYTSPITSSINLTSTPSVRKALSPSSHTAKSSPVATSRGSPKHKRIHAISKRRTSSFRRVDPPSFTQSSPAPFSIDAALSGSLSTYTPKSTPAATPAALPASAPAHVSTLEDSMPSSWFFAIHEDTPEQEATNLMEHSASVLDISSDDELGEEKRREERERVREGNKENIAPEGWVAAGNASYAAIATIAVDSLIGPDAAASGLEVPEKVTKCPRLRKPLAQDAMDEDRKPLGDLQPSEFYAEGCDASSYVTVDAGCAKPSGLSRQLEISASMPEEEVVVSEVTAQEVIVENTLDKVVVATDVAVTGVEEVAAVAEDAVCVGATAASTPVAVAVV